MWTGSDGLARDICRRCRRLNVGCDLLGPCRCEVHAAHACRELYEHHIDEPCPCDDCRDERAAALERLVLTVAAVLVLGLWLVLR